MTISSTIFVGICLLLGLHSFTVKATSMPALLSVSRKAGGEALQKTRRHGARDDEEMAQENAAKTLPTTLAKDKELKKLISLMSRSLLQQQQLMRDVLAIVLDCWLGSGDNAASEGSKSQGIAYNEAVKNKGHGLGGPWIYTFAGFVVGLLEDNSKVGEADRQSLAVLKDFYKEYDVMPIAAKQEMIRFFKVRKTFKSEVVRVTLAFGIKNEKSEKTRSAFFQEMEVNNWTLKQGRAPASYMERDLQDWMESLK